MDDAKIIALYWARQEDAIRQTDRKYGRLCRKLAMNILRQPLDAQECVQDSYLRVWNTIPPQRPCHFKAWLCRIVRHICLDRYDALHAQKRFAGVEESLDELQECLPSSWNVEESIQQMLLQEILERWLDTLSAADRVLFVRRYFLGESVAEAARLLGLRANTASQRLKRMRGSLRTVLQEEGVKL